MEARSKDSQEVLKRIQKETQRVKRRLAEDSGPKQRQEQCNNNQHPSFEVTAPHGTVQEVSPNHREFLIEASTGSYFEDPVPANQMSNHLKNEHEAFKARCVVSGVLGAVSAFGECLF
jgi:hypothetical protein